MRAVVRSIALLGVVLASAASAAPVHAEDAEDGDGDQPSQEMGARLGLELGGRVTPGGGHVSGTYLYRLTEDDWLDQSVSFTFGGNGATCFRNRDNDVLCDHGILDGFGAELAVGIRRYLAPQGKFAPYVRAGIAVRGAFFSADDLRGVAFPLWAGGGVRAQVAPRVHVVGDATIRTGFGLMNRGLGIEPHASLSIDAGVEFTLD